MSGNIKVVVRCRPLNSRELARGAKCLIRMEGGTHTFLEPPPIESDPSASAKPKTNNAAERETKSFAFDHSYWSAGPKDEPGYASQQALYEDLGVDLLDNSFEDGQTGSGKSYSMMGYGQDRGIIPLTCSALFDRITEKMSQDPAVIYTVEVSFMEIYNERVRDLLNPKNKGNLRVREHPSLGPYVEDLSKLAVQSYADVETLMDEGNKARTVAATNMNETSSRSHSVFTLLLTQRRKDATTGMEGEKVSRISLVDLAGSERANSTGATGVRLKEGAQINKSLTTLGKVISALATAGGAATNGKKKKADEHVPYRDSVLTWLLKDSLGGNSKTAMIAAISPADYDETLSTLRYADQAKKIKNKAVVNEDPNAKLIRELKEELLTLRTRISGNSSEETYDVTLPPEKQIVTYQTKTGEIKKVTKAALQEQLEQSEKLMSEVAQTWEEKLMKTEVVQKEREKALEELGITIEKNNVGVHTPKRMPHLVNLNEDPLMSECLIYQIKPGTTMVGSTETTEPCDIRLSGTNILPQHCHFESDKDSGIVQLFAHENAPTMINGRRLSPGVPKTLRSGYRVILGDYHIFRFNHPEEVRKHREKVKNTTIEMGNELRSPGTELNNGEQMGSLNGSTSPLPRPDTPTTNSVIDGQDYHYARREAVISKLNGTEVNLDEMDENEFERLFDDVVRLRMHRKGTSASVSGRESRMSFISEEEDYGSSSNRPPSGSTFVTDDTSVAGSRTSADEEEDIKKLSEVCLSEQISREDLKTEREEMENQMKVMKEEMEKKLIVQKQKFKMKVQRLKTKNKKISEDGTVIDGNDEDDYEEEEEEEEEADWTEVERKLVKIAIERWKKFNRVKMVEKILKKSIVLKEANVISKELNKMVIYQFIILDGFPFELIYRSQFESIKGLNEFDDDVSDLSLLIEKQRPMIGIKVLDRKHRSVYVWSLEKLELRLSQMRNLTNFIDRPEFSQHFNWEDPFYDPFPPLYSFIGYAFIPLGPLYRNMPVSSTLTIYSPYTLTQMGTCRVRIRIIGIAPPARTGILLNSPNGTQIPVGKSSLCPLADGSKITLEIVIDEVHGLTSRDFSSIHCQIRASSITGSCLKDGVDDQVFSSEAVDLPSDGKQLILKQVMTVVMSPETKEHLATNGGPIEFFAQLMPSYLERLERSDEKKVEESSMSTKGMNNQNIDNGNSPTHPMDSSLDHSRSSSSSGSNGLKMRQPETEFVCEQVHDVMTSIQILELSSTGEYLWTPIISQNALDPGAFDLKQGLQRKLRIRMSHNSGRQLGWQKIKKVEIGNVRLIDGQGRIHGSRKVAKWVMIRASNRVSARYESDGTSWMEFIGNWDAGGHESDFMNRVTGNEQRVLVELRWELEVKDCMKSIEFKMDLGMTIKEREQTIGNGIKRLLKIGSRKLKEMTNLYSIILRPMMINSIEELWRLNTNQQIIKGEEKLKNWKVRGISIVNEMNEFRKKIIQLNDLGTIKMIINQLNQSKIANDLILMNENNNNIDLFKIGKSLELWQKKFGPKEEMKFLEEPDLTQGNNNHHEDRKMIKVHERVDKYGKRIRKLKAEVRLIPKHENVIKKGKMNVLRDPTRDDWVERWFVLKRPYLYIYQKADEIDELGVINLKNVHIDSNPELESMLNRKNVFAIYSSTNSYFLESLNPKELNEWCSSIQPFID